MPTITRRFEFDYGHRVLGHEGKCKNLHGHHGVAEVTVWAPDLDTLGRVVDFSVLKEKVGEWINSHWDHKMLLYDDDPLGDTLQRLNEPYTSVRYNPTAESMAQDLWIVARNILSTLGLDILSVKFYETPNCWAIYPDPKETPC